jgi:signal transduction histidine kinase
LKYSGASGSCDCNSEGIISGCKAKDFILFGYENEFKQVILNIVNNSKDEFLEKNIKNGAVYITVDKDGKNIMIKICDNAGGIPNNIISKIFDPYFTTKGVQGTGIGLYMSKAIIENNMGGKLSVRNIDDGVEFMIELPQTIDSRG